MKRHDGVGHLSLDGGQTYIVSPKGGVLTERAGAREELFIADLDLELITDDKLMVDSARHYARPDIVRLTIDRRPQVSVTESFTEEEKEGT